jgi:hypothetical protein
MRSYLALGTAALGLFLGACSDEPVKPVRGDYNSPGYTEEYVFLDETGDGKTRTVQTVDGGRLEWVSEDSKRKGWPKVMSPRMQKLATEITRLQNEFRYEEDLQEYRMAKRAAEQTTETPPEEPDFNPKVRMPAPHP